jgi:hypothetical protein
LIEWQSRAYEEKEKKHGTYEKVFSV